LTEDTYFNLDFFAQEEIQAEKGDLSKVVDC
ncbi:MAG: cytoplasmic protein, partial [Hafnia sp.]